MTGKTYWGLAALVIILIAAGVVVYWQWSSVQQFKDQPAREAKQLEEYNKMVIENNLPSAAPGKKWVRHDDYFHEVSIDAPDTGQEEPIDTQEQSESAGPSVEVDYPNPDNPVQALREYLEKRGHWSAEYIPDFPPEDTEAAQMARNVLIMLAHRDAGNKFYDGPVEQSNREFHQTLERFKLSIDPPSSDIFIQRSSDIYKLSWATLDEPFIDAFFKVLPQIRKRGD